MHVYTHCLHTHTHIMFTWTYTYHTHACLHTHTHIMFTWTFTYTHTHILMYTYIYTSIHTYIQMVACLGQQSVGGARIQNGFVSRTLPHFPVGSLEPNAKGFVVRACVNVRGLIVDVLADCCPIMLLSYFVSSWCIRYTALVFFYHIL